ncbi:gliding motility-associated C-terminal domain-containing protein [Mangrovimonas cancribranchiae]|uniref:Gliding motility-associated C-terminal domain-containing protein n=1 Tax=Mangrovimonas cancribranchiae TaxID=3080055 RepID=A0AAU6NUZ4_9FLAO
MKKITLSILFGFMAFFGYSQIGLVENFDGQAGLPPGWTTDSYNWTVAEVCNVISLRGNLNDTNTTDQLTSPNIAGQSNGTDVNISFDYKVVDWSAGTQATPPGWGQMDIQYSTDDGGSWTTITTIDDGNHTTSNTCATFNTVLPAADIPTGSDFKLRFANTWVAGDYYFYIDNVVANQVVADPPSCVTMTTPVNGETSVSINTTLSWSSASGLPNGYVLSVGTTPGGTEIIDNEDVGLSTFYNTLPVLDYSTIYYVSIIPYNDNGPAIDCEEQIFTTGADPNAPVDCASGTPINVIHCYTNNDTTTWNFQSSSGAPLNVFFNSGGIESCCDDIFIYDGTDNTGTLLYGGNNGGDLAGLSINSTGDSIFIEIDADPSVSCDSGSTCCTSPWNFDVSCIDETAVPNCNADLTTPTNGATDVDVATQITWSPASVVVTGYYLSLGTTPGGTDIADNLDLGNVLSYTPSNILPYETDVYVTITPYNDNGSAVNCSEYTFTTEQNPYQCAAEDQCVFTFTIEDSWGDGWNGNTMSVLQDGLEVAILGEDFTSGAGPIEYQIPLCDGIPFELFWNDGGSFAGEVSVVVVDAFDEEIFNMPNGNGDLQGTSLFSDMVNCTPPTCPRPSDLTIVNVTPTSVEVSWTSNGTEDTWEVIVQPQGTGYPDGTEPEIIQTMDNPYLYENLTPGVDYEIYVRAICAANDMSDWEGTVNFSTPYLVDCDAGQVINETHCYDNGNNQYVEIYSFQSSNGDPLNIFFHAGTIETCCDTIRLEEADGTVIYEGTGNGGDLTGLSFSSTGDTIVMFVEADGSVSCSSGSRVEWDFSVSCVDTTAVPNCNASLTLPVDGAVDVDENTDLTWSPASIIVTGYTLYVGTAPGTSDVIDGLDVGDVLTYDLGTLVYDTTYYVTIVPYNDNGNAADCTEYSFTTRPDPNQIIDCEAGQVFNTTYCYTDNDPMEFYFASSSGYPLSLEFNAGEIEETWDEIIILDSDGSVLYQGDNGGDLTGLSFISSGDTLTIQIDSDGFGSCSSSGYIPWDFDVWCQTCITQDVSFNIINGDCVTDPDNPVFEVAVDISDMGDAESLTITDDQSADSQEVFETGTVVLGPYPASTNVVVTVANTNDSNCIVESNPLAFLCPPPPNPCSIAYAGEDQVVDCENPEATLSANFHLYGQDTENYEINAIDTCPSPPVDGATPTSVDSDDVWSEVIDLGFEFCFYGGVYDQVIIGSNGVISFETQYAGTGNGWAFDDTDTLPNNDNASITEGNIFGVGHDIDPSVCGSIDYVVLGSAPYRQFVVNFNDVCHFSCNDIQSTSQIVLHESSNNIDIHIIEKPTCPGWNDGLAVVGLQSIDDTQATTPPGRNMGVWTVTEPESWRFSPSGTPNYTLEWLDEDGNSVGNTETVTVSPGETENYTFEVTYDLCTGGQATVSDEVLVEYIGGDEFDATFTMEPTCDGGIATLSATADTGGTFELDPAPTDTAVIDPATGEVTSGTPGETYTVQYTTLGNCPAIETQTVTVLGVGDASFTMEPTCDGATATITGDAGGTFAFNPAPTDDAVINPNTGEITGGNTGTMYTVEYTSPGDCPAVSTQTVTTLSGGDPTITVAPTCDGGTVTIVGDAGGTFAFNPMPNDGAVINPTTGEVTGGTPGATYTIEYTVTVGCTVVGTQSLTVLPAEDATFTMEPTCDGAIATITGDMGGTFAFNPVPTDDAVINPNTGEITGGTPDTSYTVEYTTAGDCPQTEMQTVTTLPLDDATFTMVSTPCGAEVDSVITPGGTFTFNPEPNDGALIDPQTGEITGAMPNTDYTVEYTTPGECWSTSTVTVTPEPGDDPYFEMEPTVCGAQVVEGSVMTPGGTFSFDSSPSDGAEINSNTGEITGGTIGTTYSVLYTTAGDCPEFMVVDVTVEVCTIPQLITPNNDGNNDVFDLDGFNVSSLEIFNRYGVKVYSKQNYTDEFGGISDDGEELPTGTYYYVMKYQGNQVKTAWLYINRQK